MEKNADSFERFAAANIGNNNMSCRRPESEEVCEDKIQTVLRWLWPHAGIQQSRRPAGKIKVLMLKLSLHSWHQVILWSVSWYGRGPVKHLLQQVQQLWPVGSSGIMLQWEGYVRMQVCLWRMLNLADGSRSVFWFVSYIFVYLLYLFILTCLAIKANKSN